MKERPILFSGPMVQAILDGRKTQTRRIVKPQPEPVIPHGVQWHAAKTSHLWNPSIHVGPVEYCPHGQAGDRLWVRETWRPHFDDNEGTCIKYRADGAVIKPLTWSAQEGHWAEEHENEPRWYPSIFMRRSFSRLTLEITGVRVERLQDISGNDAIAEGVEKTVTDLGNATVTTFRDYLTGSTDRAARQSYQTIWQSINGTESWDANPWVWVIEFQLHQTAMKAIEQIKEETK